MWNLVFKIEHLCTADGGNAGGTKPKHSAVPCPEVWISPNRCAAQNIVIRPLKLHPPSNSLWVAGSHCRKFHASLAYLFELDERAFRRGLAFSTLTGLRTSDYFSMILMTGEMTGARAVCAPHRRDGLKRVRSRRQCQNDLDQARPHVICVDEEGP